MNESLSLLKEILSELKEMNRKLNDLCDKVDNITGGAADLFDVRTEIERISDYGCYTLKDVCEKIDQVIDK